MYCLPLGEVGQDMTGIFLPQILGSCIVVVEERSGVGCQLVNHADKKFHSYVIPVHFLKTVSV